jgi:hypothetical protein
MRNISSAIVVTTMFAFTCIVASSVAQNKNTIQAAKAPNSISRQDSIKTDVKFEYLVKTENCNTIFSQIKDKYSITRNVIKVQFCGGGGACTNVFWLTRNTDTLNINGKCAPKSEMQHVRCYSVICKISGLKKGVYCLKYGDAYHGNVWNKVEIK